MSVVSLHQGSWQYEHITNSGSELVLFSINTYTLEISGLAFDRKGVICKYESDEKPHSSSISCRSSHRRCSIKNSQENTCVGNESHQRITYPIMVEEI